MQLFQTKLFLISTISFYRKSSFPTNSLWSFLGRDHAFHQHGIGYRMTDYNCTSEKDFWDHNFHGRIMAGDYRLEKAVSVLAYKRNQQAEKAKKSSLTWSYSTNWVCTRKPKLHEYWWGGCTWMANQGSWGFWRSVFEAHFVCFSNSLALSYSWEGFQFLNRLFVFAFLFLSIYFYICISNHISVVHFFAERHRTGVFEHMVL